ncbi:hypothetical protein AK88_00303 [Plasmodium fragile]|uniref:Uncharacterized protein n=1 Tax=Plasmodium fragile TaxID=5857 RepID=A0A0D9QSW8_PLAFR|nr:uncharacterized protein AK88_00303 [Plasmodium fragile]KJP90134.1 hypothetical protein AK88_00303 [Plasmodium fragile]
MEEIAKVTTYMSDVMKILLKLLYYNHYRSSRNILYLSDSTGSTILEVTVNMTNVIWTFQREEECFIVKGIVFYPGAHL